MSASPAASASPAGELLATSASEAGLDADLAPFPRAVPFAEALARNPFLMAPMAGVSDRAYRLMARAGGAALAYSEMVSATGLEYDSSRTWELLDPDAAEPDLAVQLFGADPARFRRACSRIAERLGAKLALIDVNMACPVPKVTRRGEGSALLDDPALAQGIVRACRRGLEDAGSAVPVTAKIRLGRTPERPVAVPFARALEEAGASAVAVHGRFASQLYRGSSDDAAVARVAGAVSVPVIGSGDVTDEARARPLIEEAGCSGVFFARGSYGDPWVFDRARGLLAGASPDVPNPAQRMAAWRLHVRLLSKTGQHILKARTISCLYLKGLPGAARWRDRAMGCGDEAEFIALSRDVEEALRRGGLA